MSFPFPYTYVQFTFPPHLPICTCPTSTLNCTCLPHPILVFLWPGWAGGRAAGPQALPWCCSQAGGGRLLNPVKLPPALEPVVELPLTAELLPDDKLSICLQLLPVVDSGLCWTNTCKLMSMLNSNLCWTSSCTKLLSVLKSHLSWTPTCVELLPVLNSYLCWTPIYVEVPLVLNSCLYWTPTWVELLPVLNSYLFWIPTCVDSHQDWTSTCVETPICGELLPVLNL